MFISKRLSLLTTFALVVTSLSGLASAASASTSPFSTFTVNGTAVVDGSVVVISPDTKSADVVVSGTLPYDINAGVSTTGATAESVPNADFTVSTLTNTFSNLPFGDSELWVRTGNALEPESIHRSTITLRVTPMLSSLTVGGIEVADGGSLDLSANTSSVEVVATAVDPLASVTVVGATELQVGTNELLVTVVDSNNVTGVYTVTLNVPASTDTNATITINDESISSGDNMTVPYGTAEVTVAVALNDPNATYFVTGDLGLETGDNTVTVTVTAADTVTIEEYTFNVEVLLNTDTSVNSITINGTPVVDGDEIDVEPLTTEITVDVDVVDTDAVVEIVGDVDLVVGGNLVTVIVTAADGATTQEYQFTVNVLINTDTSVLSINVAGFDVADADFVTVDPLTTEVEVLVELTDPEASYSVEGGTDLVPGDNDLLITVTAADGETTQEYFITITVLPNTDTSVSTLEVNGEAVDDGSVIEVDPYTEEVNVDVVTTDELASFVVDGNEGLVVGENTVTITVTAADEETTQDYVVTVIVLASTDTSLALLNVAGFDVEDADTVTVDPLTTEVEVLVEVTDPEASYIVEGGTDLVVGDNDLLITVTAADGETTQEYFITITVLPNTDTSIYNLEVNGEAVEDGSVIEVDAYTQEVTVDVVTTDELATFFVDGNEGLVVGENTVTITVTAADEETTQDYLVTVIVLASTDTSLSSLEVNGEAVEDGSVIEVPAFTEEVTVDVVTTDEFASFVVDGNEGLVVGENTITITVTAPDEETTQDYYVTVMVALSNDASLADLSVFWTGADGEESASAADGDVIDLAPGTTEVDVVVEPTDSEATYEITGGTDLVLGANELIVVITAPDGEATETFTVTLNVLPFTDATFTGIEVNGKSWVEDEILEVDAGDLDIQVALNNEFANILVTPSGGARTVVRDGFGYIVASGFAELLIEVTAQDGETVESATILVWATSNVSVVQNTATADRLLRVGTFVKLPRSQFDSAAKLTYGWLRNGEETGITAAKYLLTAEDFGADLRPVITLTKKGAAPVTILGKPFEVAEGVMTKAPVPTVKGKAVVGNTLTATTKDWMDGTELSYQWYRDGAPIDGANSDTYDLIGEDGETKVTVGITGTLTGYESMEKISNGLNIALGALKYSDKPSISGPYVTGGVLEVNVGSWQDEAEISIVWLRDGDVFYEGPADENTYELTSDDYASRIGVQVKVSATGYKSVSFSMKSRLIKLGTVAEIPTPVISGEAIVGGLLTADPGEYPNGAEFFYVWKRNGKVVQGSTDSSYEVNSRDVNTTLSVKVIAKIPGYKTTRIDSDGIDVSPAQ
ncbi:MAG: cadherin-like beta sandwich domain-containing protein [Rhodoluna sp.]|nr:cadherin-like beta sandwich domain-containing protein [Rhodoluna sp.]